MFHENIFLLNTKKISMPPLLVQNIAFDDARNISKYVELAQTSLGIHTFSLSFHDVKRLILVDESDPEFDVGKAREDSTDYLSKMLTEQVGAFCDTDLVSYCQSLGTLFKSDKQHRELLPRVWLAIDLRNHASCVGALNSLRYPGPDASVSTEFLTPQFIQKNDLPQFDASWILVDLVCSNRSPTASLLVMSVFRGATRGRARRPTGIMAVSINERSRKTFSRLGFSEIAFRSHGKMRWLMYANTSDITMSKVMERLRFDENTLLLSEICYRSGLQKKTEDKIYGRC